MQTLRAFSRSLAAAALTAALGLASPAFASNDDNHAEGSDDHGKNGHSENHGAGSDDGNHSENHGGTPSLGLAPLRATLAGTVEPGARGEAKLKTKLRGNTFEAEVKFPVPSVALAVPNKAAALDATLTLSLSRSGVAYAECDFDLKSFKANNNGRRIAGYKIEVANRAGVIQSRYGICDVDLASAGIQSGVPAVQAGDVAAVKIDTNGLGFLDGVF